MPSLLRASKQFIICATTIVLSFLHANAQSDVKAKDMYNEAEKYYEDATKELQALEIHVASREYNFIADKFSAAANRCMDLRNAKDKWDQPTLELYLKCANQCLKIERFEDAATYVSKTLEGPIYVRFTNKEGYVYKNFRPNYENYKNLYGLCTTLLADNYPADKAGEIKDIQGRFKDQMALADFEHTLTTDDALKFLNMCAEKFQSKVHFKKQSGKKGKEVDEPVQWKITFTDNRYLNFFAPQMPETAAAKIDMAQIDPSSLFDNVNPGLYDATSVEGGMYTPTCFFTNTREEAIFVDKAFLFVGPWGNGSLGILLDGMACLEHGVLGDAYFMPFPNLKDMSAFNAEQYPYRTARAFLFLYEIAQRTVASQQQQPTKPVEKKFGF